MNTLYELFKVSENASKQEIDDAYKRIIEKANSLPQTDELIEKVRRIKIAYGILTDDEKRKKYNMDLATKRADELLETIKPAEKENVKEIEEVKYSEVQYEQQEEQNQNSVPSYSYKIQNNVNLENLKKNVDKAVDNYNKLNDKERKKQERRAKRLAKKELEYQREKEIQNYGRYLESQGYKVKYPWTWSRVKRLLISIITLIIIGFILWHIPPIRKQLVALYEENFVIKFFIDAIISLISSIFGGAK